MPGAYWYYGLLFSSFVLLFVSIRHDRNWKLLILHLNIGSIIQPFETVVMMLDGYQYMPGILRPGIDSYCGAVISDYFIIPASAVTISAFSLAWPARILIAAVFTGIDWYFTVLGIYEHYWWKSIYTGLGLIILYAISGWLWTRLKDRRPSPAFRLLVIFLSYSMLHSLITFVVNRGDLFFQLQLPLWHIGMDKMHSVLVAIHQLLMAVTVTLGIGLRLCFRYRLLAIVIIAGINWLIGHLGVFVPTVAISPQCLILVPLTIIIFLVILFRAANLDYLFP